MALKKSVGATHGTRFINNSSANALDISKLLNMTKSQALAFCNTRDSRTSASVMSSKCEGFSCSKATG